MKRIENNCVLCGLPCLGNTCPYIDVPHYYCDECGDEVEIYEFDDQELCINCIKPKLKRIDNEQ